MKTQNEYPMCFFEAQENNLEEYVCFKLVDLVCVTKMKARNAEPDEAQKELPVLITIFRAGALFR